MKLLFVVLTIAISLVSVFANSSKATSRTPSSDAPVNNAEVLPGQAYQSSQEVVPIVADMPPKDEDHLPGGSR